MAKVVSAKFKITGWDTNQIKLRVGTIMDRYASAMDKQLKEEIQKVQFPLDDVWPGLTRRRNGSVVGSPRNIVDTGRFLGSQRRERPNFSTILFTWDAKSPEGFPYAPLILRGYTTNKGTVVPPRDWIRPALEALPLDRFFAAEWKKLAGQGL